MTRFTADDFPALAEKIARALCGQYGYDPDDMAEARNVGGPMWMAFRQDARTVLNVVVEELWP